MDRRTKARELAMQAMYQLDVQGDDYLDQLDMFLRENCSDDMVFEQASSWSRKAWESLSVCDGLIKQAAIKWELSRLSSVDRSILRLSTYQLKFCTDIPGKVVINEAIEIAKKYSGQQSPGFVNGVLDAILKKLKQAEKEVSH